MKDLEKLTKYYNRINDLYMKASWEVPDDYTNHYRKLVETIRWFMNDYQNEKDYLKIKKDCEYFVSGKKAKAGWKIRNILAYIEERI